MEKNFDEVISLKTDTRAQLDAAKTLQRKYGSYNRLLLDIRILMAFLNKGDDAVLRQIEIIDMFPEFHRRTIQKHLRSLCKRNVLKVDRFPGQYKVYVVTMTGLHVELCGLMRQLLHPELYDFLLQEHSYTHKATYAPRV